MAYEQTPKWQSGWGMGSGGVPQLLGGKTLLKLAKKFPRRSNFHIQNIAGLSYCLSSLKTEQLTFNIFKINAGFCEFCL